MRSISPNTGAPERVFAEEQEEYYPLSVALYEHESSGTRICLMRYKLNDEERKQVAAGEDIFLSMLGGVAPHTVTVGKPNWA